MHNYYDIATSSIDMQEKSLDGRGSFTDCVPSPPINRLISIVFLDVIRLYLVLLNEILSL